MLNRLKCAVAALALAALAAGPVAAQEVDVETDPVMQDRIDRVVENAAEEAAERAQERAEERAAQLDSATADDRDEAELRTEDRQSPSDDREKGYRGTFIGDLGASEGAEHDEHGFPVRHSELVGIDVPPSTLSAALARGFKLISRRSLKSLDHEIVVIAVPSGMSVLAARKIMRDIDRGAAIDFVHYYGLGLTAGRPGHPANLDARQRAREPLTVGMVDTAVSAHEMLANSKINRWLPGNQASAPLEHGTAVASLLAMEGNATIYAANIFRGPVKRPFTSADVIIDALEWLMASKVQTVNVSLAGPRNLVVDRLILDAIASGHTFVAAAGNDGPSAPPAYPAALPGVIAVTAVDRSNRIYRYANHGTYITVAALGVDVVAARAAGGIARFTGTSFAAPHIAGWMARCRTSGNSAANCRERLSRAAKNPKSDGFDDVYGFGVVD